MPTFFNINIVEEGMEIHECTDLIVSLFITATVAMTAAAWNTVSARAQIIEVNWIRFALVRLNFHVKTMGFLNLYTHLVCAKVVATNGMMDFVIAVTAAIQAGRRLFVSEHPFSNALHM